MKKLDDYINKIYKNFDEKDEETIIMKEETKAHLYEEVEELKKQGLSEEESIKKAISNFGQENLVINEMNDILNKQNKFAKILTRVALVIFLVGVIFKGINLACDFAHVNHELYTAYDQNTSEYAFQVISSKISNKTSLDENTKQEITTFLDKFNERTNGLYYIAIRNSSKVEYEYKKDVPKEMATINGNGGLRGINQFSIDYKLTDSQDYYDSQVSRATWDKINNSIPNVLNQSANYLFLSAWILICVSLISKVYSKNLISKGYLGFFVVASILIVGLFLVNYHTFQELMVLVIGAVIALSIYFNKGYVKRKLI
ncbi:permease prefix domain 1-containing protein [Inconstantimicrobium mannanitabidum]|uniref:Uncharacterized protein n=1 Tax=Inconstantimicrobium mannanitabidum TaxID=1604901 RepID=A0ACB5RFX3_9CLOT|nr:permease prefix domain 1-containing protein [Clostridium sp. TW13]GKX67958.1 hypothetical protein rsdtw13_32160 [Clostridium sp. TW13]